MLHSFCSRFRRQVVKFIKCWPPATAVVHLAIVQPSTSLLEGGDLSVRVRRAILNTPEEYIMLMFALRVCYCITTGEDEGQMF